MPTRKETEVPDAETKCSAVSTKLSLEKWQFMP